MPMKVGGKGHQQSYDPTTGKYGSGNAIADTEEKKKSNLEDTENKGNFKKEEEDNTKKSFSNPISILDMLIADEEEAIESYKKAIKFFEKDNAKITKILKVVLEDEEEHKKVLEMIKNKKGLKLD